ncbi:vesicular glutamate transporter 1-like [Hetaerina americana]|uniref:vesicular glutamate transporter 1-like n=1 Tax=Hetaerina americana TaxID=62018 RepID=UPI003A7F61B9
MNAPSASGDLEGEKDYKVPWYQRKHPILRRYVIATLAFFGFWNIYALRVNLSVAVVAMTTNYSISVPGSNVTTYRQDFDWDLPTRGLLLSSFFYGYIVTQIPGGWLATRLGGGARVYGIGVAATAILTLLTPPIAYGSLTMLFILRIVEGFFEGVTFPAIHAVWSRWAPPLERSRLATIAFSGSYFGTVISLPLSSLLANAFGWESIFYVFGVIGLIWFSLWWWLVYESPELDPRISKEELVYIQESLGGNRAAERHHPWRKFLTSLPVWSIVVAHFSENWGFYTLLTQLPTFMKDTLEFDLNKAGFLSALPYLVMTIVLQMAGYLADYLRALSLTVKRGNTVAYILSTTGVRKIFNCGAFLSQTIFMLLAAHSPSAGGAIAGLTLAVGLGGFAWSGFSVNHLDIAPQHASVLMGLSNTVATLPGIISPAITGYIVQNKTAAEWKIVFYISSIIYLLGAVFYGTFASGELQPWAQVEEGAPKSDGRGEDGKNGKDAENGLCYTNEVIDERL